jgi:DNA-binding MarR family transcriptional regulator
MKAAHGQSSAEVEAFFDAWDELVRAQHRARGRFNRAPDVPELSLSQYHLLEPLAGAGPMCVGELAVAADVATPTATRMLDGLERRGLVTRARSEDDRRQVRVALSDAGAELVERKRGVIREARREVFDTLSASDRRGAARVLKALAAAIEELQP